VKYEWQEIALFYAVARFANDVRLALDGNSGSQFNGITGHQKLAIVASCI
jgi:hypothetical protein